MTEAARKSQVILVFGDGTNGIATAVEAAEVG